MVFHIQKRQPRFIILPQYSRLTTVLAFIVYTLVIHPESPERNDVALGELDVVFHYICVSDIFNLLSPFLSAAYFEGVFPYDKIRYTGGYHIIPYSHLIIEERCPQI